MDTTVFILILYDITLDEEVNQNPVALSSTMRFNECWILPLLF